MTVKPNNIPILNYKFDISSSGYQPKDVDAASFLAVSLCASHSDPQKVTPNLVITAEPVWNLFCLGKLNLCFFLETSLLMRPSGSKEQDKHVSIEQADGKKKSLSLTCKLSDS